MARMKLSSDAKGVHVDRVRGKRREGLKSRVRWAFFGGGAGHRCFWVRLWTDMRNALQYERSARLAKQCFCIASGTLPLRVPGERIRMQLETPVRASCCSLVLRFPRRSRSGTIHGYVDDVANMEMLDTHVPKTASVKNEHDEVANYLLRYRPTPKLVRKSKAAESSISR